MPISFSKLKRSVLILSALFLAGLFLVSCASNQPQSSAVSSSSKPEVPLASAAALVSSASSAPPALAKDRDIDFDTLAKQNPDVVAWIEVPGTDIDYPVLYSGDNSYYLTHDIDKNYYAGGSIFLDMKNSPQISDPLVTIYGHLMPDDTLFTQLHLFSDQDFFAENRTVKIFTEEHQINYEIVAAITVDNRYVFYNMDVGKYIDYSSKEDMQYFLDWIAATKDLAAIVEMDNCTTADEYLVLSTCTPVERKTHRFIVVAKKVDTI